MFVLQILSSPVSAEIRGSDLDQKARKCLLSPLVIPACLPRYGVEPGAGHMVKRQRYPESDLLTSGI